MSADRARTPHVLSATSIIGDRVVDPQGADLGQIEEIMIELDTGRVAYAVLSFGGVLGVGNKLFAIPWRSLLLDAPNKRFILNIDRSKLEHAPGFDKDNWPDTADHTWLNDIYTYYGFDPYWDA